MRPDEPLLKELQLYSIYEMVEQESTRMVHKALNTKALLYLTEQFNRASNTMKRNLRSSNLNLRPP